MDLLLCGPFHFGIALKMVGKAGEPIIASVDRLTQVVFEVLSFARSTWSGPSRFWPAT